MAAKIARGGRTFQGCYLSAHLVTAVRQSPLTDTELAAQIGASVYTLQAWLRAYTRTRRDDPRVVRLGALVGVPAHACYEAD